MYWLVNRMSFFVLKVFFRFQVTGRENIPKEGPVIAVANHVSVLDPPALSVSINRQVYFMAKEELFKNPVLGWVFKKIGTFPVKRGVGDRGAIKRSMSILAHGNVLGMFPEGTRRGGDVQQGVVFMAIKTGAPILPVALFNTDRKKSKGPIKAIIGKPFTLPVGNMKPTKEERRDLAMRIMESIRELS